MLPVYVLIHTVGDPLARNATALSFEQSLTG